MRQLQLAIMLLEYLNVIVTVALKKSMGSVLTLMNVYQTLAQ
jgi:hypothetical protein